jgi:hypothetical protein
MQRGLLDVRRRVLGPEHPGTLHTVGNLACFLRDQGKHAEAEQMEREVLDVNAGCWDRSIETLWLRWAILLAPSVAKASMRRRSRWSARCST